MSAQKQGAYPALTFVGCFPSDRYQPQGSLSCSCVRLYRVTEQLLQLARFRKTFAQTSLHKLQLETNSRILSRRRCLHKLISTVVISEVNWLAHESIATEVGPSCRRRRAQRVTSLFLMIDDGEYSTWLRHERSAIIGAAACADSIRQLAPEQLLT